MSRSIPTKLTYQPALDGLRALAVIAVMVHHQSRLEGGFLGVDVFFVLSGFLITSLLLIDYHHRGRVISARFWAHRARRLFPALLVFLVLVALYAAVVATPYDLGALRSGSFATLFYVQNYVLAARLHQGHYPLSHTWSLSIEEQFYIVWPLLLALLLRITRRMTHVAVAVAVLAGASALLMAHRYANGGTNHAYFPTETRAQELLVGALLAILLLGWSGPANRVRGVILEVAGALALCLLAILTLTIKSNASWLYRGGFLLVGVASAVLIAAAVSPMSTRLRRVLGVKPLVAIGLISYGLYLYHIPLYGFVNSQDTIRNNEAARIVLGFALAFAVATASYFWIERPIRRGKLSAARLRVVAPTAVATVVALVLLSTAGAVSLSGKTLADLAYIRMADETPRGSARVLVAGDSLAGVLAFRSKVPYTAGGIQGAVIAVFECDGLGGRIAAGSGVLPARNCLALPSLFKNAVDSFKPHVVVLMMGPSTIYDRVVGTRRLRVGTPAFEAYLDRRLDLLRRILTAHGARLLLTTVPCMTPPASARNTAFVAVRRDPSRLRWINAVWLRYAAKHRNEVTLEDYRTFLCPADKTLASSYRSADGVGLTTTGALATWEWIAPIAAKAQGR